MAYFLSHAVTWMSPKNMAISLHSTYLSFPIADVRKICTMAVDTKEMLLSAVILQYWKSMFPCIFIRSSDFWQRIDNHNRTLESWKKSPNESKLETNQPHWQYLKRNSETKCACITITSTAWYNNLFWIFFILYWTLQTG